MDLIIDSQIVQSLLLIVIFLAILVEIKTGGTGYRSAFRSNCCWSILE